MRVVSVAERRRQIAREGARWGLVPMEVWGDVLVAEDVPCRIPLPCGIAIGERVRRDITGVSMEYTFSKVLRSRKHKAERTMAARLEVSHAVRLAEIEERKAAIYHEMNGEIRAADKGRQIFLR